MKFLLFIVLIVGGAIFGIKRCSDGGNKSMMQGVLGGAMNSSLAKVLPGGDAEAPPQIAGQGHSSSSTAGGKDRRALGPVGSRWYTFQHRQVPPSEFWQQIVSTGSASTDKVGVTVDADTRTAVFYGPLVKTLELVKIAEALDKVPWDCHAKVWIFWVSNSSTKGFDISAFFGGPNLTTYGIVNGPIMLGEISIGDLSLRVEAMKEMTGAVILQSPHLRLFNGKQSRIRTGADVPVPVSTTTQNQTQTTVEFRPIGLELIIEPHFFERDQVELKINQKNEFISREVQLGDNTVPEISSQELDSFVRVKVGEVALIGGVETYVSRETKGWISKKTEIETGFLYILLATYRTEALALEVFETDQAKGLRMLDEYSTNIDGLNGVLPPKPKKAPSGK